MEVSSQHYLETLWRLVDSGGVQTAPHDAGAPVHLILRWVAGQLGRPQLTERGEGGGGAAPVTV